MITDAQRKAAKNLVPYLPPISYQRISLWSGDGRGAVCGAIDHADVVLFIAAILKVIGENPYLSTFPEPDVQNWTEHEGRMWPTPEGYTMISTVEFERLAEQANENRKAEPDTKLRADPITTERQEAASDGAPDALLPRLIDLIRGANKVRGLAEQLLPTNPCCCGSSTMFDHAPHLSTDGIVHRSPPHPCYTPEEDQP